MDINVVTLLWRDYQNYLSTTRFLVGANLVFAQYQTFTTP